MSKAVQSKDALRVLSGKREITKKDMVNVVEAVSREMQRNKQSIDNIQGNVTTVTRRHKRI